MRLKDDRETSALWREAAKSIWYTKPQLRHVLQVIRRRKLCCFYLVCLGVDNLSLTRCTSVCLDWWCNLSRHLWASLYISHSFLISLSRMSLPTQTFFPGASTGLFKTTNKIRSKLRVKIALNDCAKLDKTPSNSRSAKLKHYHRISVEIYHKLLPFKQTAAFLK